MKIHGIKTGMVIWRTDGKYITASRADIRKWQHRLINENAETIKVPGRNTVDESDLNSLLAELDADARRVAGVASS